ncbi:MAG TPA: MFS transporter [Pyrinomonadaceae bacterium]|jgi:predicted MFS family arabinose efflux permease|nr:MFS transporter [Pyrinomonadaceae bacterium]
MTSQDVIASNPAADSLQASSSNSKKWIVAGILSAGLGLDYLARLAINSVFPLLRQDLQMTDFEIGLSATAFLWTYALLSPLAGFAGDKFPRRTVLALSVVSWGGVTLLCGFATETWQLLVARVLLGVSQACYIPTAQALITDLHTPRTQAKAIGIFMAGCYVGVFASGMPVAWVSTSFGWRTMFLLIGGISLVFALSMSYIPRVQPRKSTPDPSSDPLSQGSSIDSVKLLLRNKAFAGILIAFALSGAAYFILFTFLPLFIFENFGLSVEAAAFQATFYMQVGALILNPIFGAVADRQSSQQPRNRFYFAAITAATALPALAVVGFGKTTLLLTGGLLFFGVAMAGTDVSWTPMLSTVVSERNRATAYGIMNMASCFAGGTATFAGALLMKSHGLGGLMASGGIMFLVLAILLAITGTLRFQRSAVLKQTIQPS